MLKAPGIGWPSFAEASEGILLRTTNYGDPAKRVSAKQDGSDSAEQVKTAGNNYG
jgi:hypothetical protein